MRKWLDVMRTTLQRLAICMIDDCVTFVCADDNAAMLRSSKESIYWNKHKMSNELDDMVCCQVVPKASAGLLLKNWLLLVQRWDTSQFIKFHYKNVFSGISSAWHWYSYLASGMLSAKWGSLETVVFAVLSSPVFLISGQHSYVFGAFSAHAIWA